MGRIVSHAATGNRAAVQAARVWVGLRKPFFFDAPLGVVPQVAHFGLVDAVEAPETLLDPVRVPGQVVVDHQKGALTTAQRIVRRTTAIACRTAFHF